MSFISLRSIFLGTVAAAVLAAAPAANAMPVELKGSKASEGKQSITVVGDTKSDLTTSSARVGDTPVDFPGATRAPQAPATFVTVTHPRVVIDDADDALPIVLSGLALLVALGGTGYAVVRRGPLPARPTN